MFDLAAYRILLVDRCIFALFVIVITQLGGFFTVWLIKSRAGKALTPPYWVMLGAVIAPLCSRLNRGHRSYPDLVLRGATIAALSAFLSMGCGLLLQYFPSSPKIKTFAEIAGLCLLVSGGSVFWLVYILSKDVEGKANKENGDNKRGGVWKQAGGFSSSRKSKENVNADAYYSLSQSMRVNFTLADEHTLCRATAEYLVTDLVRYLVTPLFWYLVAGLPAAFFYSGISYVEWRAERGGRKRFGLFSAVAVRIFTLIPSFLTSSILILASIMTPSVSFFRGLKGLLLNSPKEKFPGLLLEPQCMTVLAWAFKVSLGGSLIDYGGCRIKLPWIGPPGSSARIKKNFLKRVLYMRFLFIVILIFVLSAFLYILSSEESVPSFF